MVAPQKEGAAAVTPAALSSKTSKPPIKKATPVKLKNGLEATCKYS
jgi:hypothetical protein